MIQSGRTVPLMRYFPLFLEPSLSAGLYQRAVNEFIRSILGVNLGVRIRIWIGIKMESRIRILIYIKTITIRNTTIFIYQKRTGGEQHIAIDAGLSQIVSFLNSFEFVERNNGNVYSSTGHTFNAQQNIFRSRTNFTQKAKTCQFWLTTYSVFWRKKFKKAIQKQLLFNPHKCLNYL